MKPLEGVITVGELIKKLKTFDKKLPVLATYTGWIREGEYFEVCPKIGNLDNQETGGDPSFYGEQECVLLS